MNDLKKKPDIPGSPTLNLKKITNKKYEWECDIYKKNLYKCLKNEPIFNCKEVFDKYSDCIGNDLFS